MAKKNLKTNIAVGNCRFSSNGQREESIDAQKRAIQKYADENNLIISNWYVDEAKTATTTVGRDEFNRMINDSKNSLFSYVIIHKLDRLSRDRYDSAVNKRALKINNVTLISVLEKIDDSPESVMYEAMLEAYAEFYSKNLSRETIKGLNENAYKSLCNGGRPPYGYIRVPRMRNGVQQTSKDATIHHL